MKPFRFRLQSLLRHARRVKDERAAEWAKARRQVDTTLGTIAHHEAELVNIRDRHALADGSPIAVAYLQTVHSHVLWHRHQLIREHAQLQDDKAVLDGATQELNLSRQECKKLEALREKQHDAWLTRELKREQKELDAVASRQRQSASQV